MKHARTLLLAAVLLCLSSACGREEPQQDERFQTESTPLSNAVGTRKSERSQQITDSVSEESVAQTDGQNNTEEITEVQMNVQAGGAVFSAALKANEAAASFVKMMQEAPVVIQMSDYSGFEKIGSLGAEIPASDRRITAHAGDIVLYNGSQIVIFYGSNTWSYTRLAHIDDLTGWEEALGGGEVTVTFSLA